MTAQTETPAETEEKSAAEVQTDPNSVDKSKAAPEPPVKENKGESLSGKKTKKDVEEKLTPEEIKARRYELLNNIVSKETFIDPMASDEITKAYSVYEKDPMKILKVVVHNFLQYCRKCIREAALVEHKNELSNATFEEAEHIRTEVTEKFYDKVKSDPELEQLLIILIFKNTFWNWVRYGLKDIFNEQRRQPGHPINNYLNTRFHKLKEKKNYKIVGDLVMADITEIVNAFKKEVMQKKIKIFE